MLYIVWGEGLGTGGVFKNQVLRQVSDINGSSYPCKVTVLLGGGFAKVWVKAVLARLGLLKNAPDTQTLTGFKTVLQHSGVIVIRWSLVNLAFFHCRWYSIPTFVWLHIWKLALLVRRKKFKILHCRSYHAAILALMAKFFLKDRVRIIFDTRGLLPEEGVALGVYSEQSCSYKIWKWVEKWLLARVDMVVNVSETLTEHLQAIQPGQRMRTIPTSVDVRVFYEAIPCVDPIPARTLVYLGGLDVQGWHSPEHLVWIYRLFRGYFGKESGLMVVTQSPVDKLRQMLGESGISPWEFIHYQSDSIERTASILKMARYAVLPFRATRCRADDLVGRTMIASKTGEYLAAGLPLICHENVGGVRRLIEKSKIGMVVCPALSQTEFSSQLHFLDENYNEVSGICRASALAFDQRLHTEQYCRIYQELVSGGS